MPGVAGRVVDDRVCAVLSGVASPVNYYTVAHTQTHAESANIAGAPGDDVWEGWEPKRETTPIALESSK